MTIGIQGHLQNSDLLRRAILVVEQFDPQYFQAQLYF